MQNPHKIIFNVPYFSMTNKYLNTHNAFMCA